MNRSKAATTAAASSGEAEGATIRSCGRRFITHQGTVAPLTMPLLAATAHESGTIAGKIVLVALFAALAIWFVRRARRNHGRRRATHALAATLAGLLAVAALATPADRDGDSWDSRSGRDMRAGFIAGCEQVGSQAIVDCECVFTRLSTNDRYDTPSKFETLRETIEDAQDAPPELITAIQACTTG